jgi:tRNA-specific 2-thiouridylase
MSLLRGVDAGKDQSYFLFALSQDQLARTMFPLGEMHKNAVREKARQLHLPAAERPESQDICFGDYKALVAKYAAPNELAGGDVVDLSGKVLGHHGGVHTVTVGQRRGLGVSAAEPLYVVDIDDASKRVVLGSKSDLSCKGLVACAVNWIETSGDAAFAAEVQIRYRAQAMPCVIRGLAENSCEVRFEHPLPAVTPGQAAVFYRGAQVLGGGWIDRALR